MGKAMMKSWHLVLLLIVFILFLTNIPGLLPSQHFIHQRTENSESITHTVLFQFKSEAKSEDVQKVFIDSFDSSVRKVLC